MIDVAPHALALGMHKDSVYVREILRAGAQGGRTDGPRYIGKRRSEETEISVDSKETVCTM